jgi:hypothetical protein
MVAARRHSMPDTVLQAPAVFNRGPAEREVMARHLRERPATLSGRRDSGRASWRECGRTLRHQDAIVHRASPRRHGAERHEVEEPPGCLFRDRMGLPQLAREASIV